MALADAVRRAFGGAQPEELSRERQAFVRECADFDTERLNRYRLYEDYYDGEQRTVLLERAKTYLERGGVRFCENVTELVVDTLADRLRLTGFQVEDNEAVSDWLTKTMWRRNRMGELQGIVHTEVPKLGDGFLLVDYDEKLQMPRARWNHPRLIKPVYGDGGDEMLYAVKKWATSNRSASNPGGTLVVRLNIYFPDRVEKWFSLDSDAQNWAPWVEAEDEHWPTPWTESGELPADGSEAEDPLGIPVIHFRNKPKGRQFGRSEIKGVIPYQEEINKQVLDLFYVMDAQGWQWPWVSGVGESEGFKLAVGDVIRLTNPEARVGQLPAADPRPSLEAIDSTYRRLAAKSRTPFHDLITGEIPSGESLKTAEGGLVKKGKDRQTTLSDPWSDTARFMWRLGALYNSEGVPVFDPLADITAIWDDPETRNEQAETNMLGVQVELLGRSRTSAQRQLGLDPEEEAELRKKEQAEAPADPSAPEPPDKPVVVEPKVPKPSPEPKP